MTIYQPLDVLPLSIYLTKPSQNRAAIVYFYIHDFMNQKFGQDTIGDISSLLYNDQTSADGSNGWTWVGELVQNKF